MIDKIAALTKLALGTTGFDNSYGRIDIPPEQRGNYGGAAFVSGRIHPQGGVAITDSAVNSPGNTQVQHSPTNGSSASQTGAGGISGFRSKHWSTPSNPIIDRLIRRGGMNPLGVHPTRLPKGYLDFRNGDVPWMPKRKAL